MPRDIATLFSRLTPAEPSAALARKIIDRIRKEERLLAVRRRLALGTLGLLMAAPLAVLAVTQLIADSAAAGITTFLSLLSTDADVVLGNLGIFTSALLESLPVTSLIGTLAASAVTAVSLFLFIAGLGAVTAERFKRRSSFLML